MQDKIHYELTAHAATVMTERKILAAWVERVLRSPERTEPDKVDSELRHALGRITEHDDRILRVVLQCSRESLAYCHRFFRPGSER